MLGHFGWPGGAVEADAVDVHRIQYGCGAADVGADQHGAGGLDGDLHKNRNVLAAFLAARNLAAVDGRLDGQQVLVGLKQKAVDTAVDQATRLLGVALFENVVAGVAEAGELGTGPHRAEHVTRLLRRAVFVGQAARDGGGVAIELVSALDQVELGEHHLVGAEGVGFDAIRASLKVRPVHLFDEIRPGGDKDLRTVLQAHEILLDVPVLGLNERACAAVTQQHALRKAFEEGRSGGHGVSWVAWPCHGRPLWAGHRAACGGRGADFSPARHFCRLGTRPRNHRQ